ncbi:MAG: hypothetical protein H6573_16795 [Lewinellaceae bacterium]|jgi:hypothetical protein|nr:hypothetical protein [Phaeodactylibacter sp.]MCB0611851.1 hypothetical protein [Phaeodactylibacter sp.]MCB9349145.1 hypothetical protein [Lewinellaceae bacterium]
MRIRKKYAMGEGKYYFTIKSVPNNITISRKSKEAAVSAFKKYKKAGKEIEWLGKWTGKEFTENNIPTAVSA